MDNLYDIYYVFNIPISEQMSLIYCGIRNDSGGIVKPNKYDSTIVQNMPGTVISFHPTDKSTYFVGTKIGFVVKVLLCFDKLAFFARTHSCSYTALHRYN